MTITVEWCHRCVAVDPAACQDSQIGQGVHCDVNVPSVHSRAYDVYKFQIDPEKPCALP